MGAPLLGPLLRAYLSLFAHHFFQGKATDPWASSRSASSASLATSSAGRRSLVRLSASRDFLSAGWGSHGGRTAQQVRPVAARTRGARMLPTAVVGSVAACGPVPRAARDATARVDQAEAVRSGAIGAPRARDGVEAGLVAVVIRGWRVVSVPSSWKLVKYWPRSPLSRRMRLLPQA